MQAPLIVSAIPASILVILIAFYLQRKSGHRHDLGRRMWIANEKRKKEREEKESKKGKH